MRVNLNFDGGFNNGYKPRNHTRVKPEGLINLHYEAIDLTASTVGKEVIKAWFDYFCPPNSTLSIMSKGSKSVLGVYRRIVVFDSTCTKLTEVKQQIQPICGTTHSFYLDISNPMKLKENKVC